MYKCECVNMSREEPDGKKEERVIRKVFREREQRTVKFPQTRKNEERAQEPRRTKAESDP